MLLFFFNRNMGTWYIELGLILFVTITVYALCLYWVLCLVFFWLVLVNHISHIYLFQQRIESVPIWIADYYYYFFLIVLNMLLYCCTCEYIRFCAYVWNWLHIYIVGNLYEFIPHVKFCALYIVNGQIYMPLCMFCL